MAIYIQPRLCLRKEIKMTHTEKIQKIIASAPREELGAWPTPFMKMAGLKRALGDGCPNIWVKREDMTPLGAGGNKIRKLEHVLAAAKKADADTLLNTGEVQSNQVVQTAACAARLGMKCELFLGRTDPPLSEDDQETGNILLCRILGANIHLVPPGEDRGEAMRKRAEELRLAGKKPYIIPRGSSTPEGALGSLRCFYELLEQAASAGFVPDAILLTVGSAGTCAGFLVGASARHKSAASPVPIYGFDVFGTDYPIESYDRIMGHAEEAWQFLGLPGKCGDEMLRLSRDYVGPGYSRPYKGMLDAVYMTARNEGLILDPNYTGKCMAGLIGIVKSGEFTSDQNIVYLHTGGMPALFAMRRHFDRD